MIARVVFVVVALMAGLALPGAASRPLSVSAAPAESIFFCSSVTDIPGPECQALIDLYASTAGAHWTNNANWLTGPTACDTWVGVGCQIGADMVNHVTVLTLEHNNLVGTLPASLGNLTQLRALQLDFNALSGPIPPQIGNLRHLTMLQLNNNGLSGSIPVEIGLLLSLNFLYLNNNGLSGPIPGELGNLVYLVCLDVGYNHLSGTVPAELGNLASLQRLCVDNNPDLSGPLPLELTHLELKYLAYNNTGVCAPGDAVFQTWLRSIPSVSSNGRTCGVPPPPPAFSCANVTDVSAAECQALVALYTSAGGSGWQTRTNWLTATRVCAWYGVGCSLGHITSLSLTNNGLKGTLPTELGNLTSLQTLSLGNNGALAGALPSTLTGARLTSLAYAGTGLCAPGDATFQNWQAGIRSLSKSGLICGVTYRVTVNTPSVSPEPSRVNASVSVSASFSDNAPQPSPYTCKVDFGDGTTVNGTVFLTTCYGGSHTYKQRGQFTIKVQVTDRLGTMGEASRVHQVN
ncbi:MAG: PKD domain-containing protein [Anaerolineae bacterium]